MSGQSEATRRAPLPGVVTRILHFALLVVGWLAFAGFWWFVQATQKIDPLQVALLLAVAIVIIPALTLIWILHNIGIYRRRHRRISAREVVIDYSQDWEGRPIDADWARLADAKVVTIDVDASGKHYRAP